MIHLDTCCMISNCNPMSYCLIEKTKLLQPLPYFLFELELSCPQEVALNSLNNRGRSAAPVAAGLFMSHMANSINYTSHQIMPRPLRLPKLQ